MQMVYPIFFKKHARSCQTIKGLIKWSHHFVCGDSKRSQKHISAVFSTWSRSKFIGRLRVGGYYQLLLSYL